MSPEENKAVVRPLFEEVINAGTSRRPTNSTPPTTRRAMIPSLGARGPEAAKRLVAAYRAAHPGFSMTVEDELAEGDKVASRYTARGTHGSEVGDVAPTGRGFGVSSICIHRVVGGRVTKGGWQANKLGMLRQLGLLPGSFPPG